MTMIPKVLALGFALVAGIALAQMGDPEYPGRTWKKSDPKSLGWSPDGLRVADEYAQSIRSDAYLVIHKGQIVHEYGEIAKTTNVHSVRKSVLSILYGIYSDAGLVDLNKTIGALGIDDKDALSANEKKATVRHLLQARSGVYHLAAYETGEMTSRRPPRGSYLPGQNWYYNNWDFNALGAIFKGFTGKSVFDSLTSDLAGPLQFEDFSSSADTKWVYQRQLSNYPAYEIRLSARDLGRIGLLMARQGRWKNKRIVSEKWVTESTSSYSAASPGIGYGYLWWVGVDGWHFGQKFPSSVFSARGYLGQFLVVDPTRDLVVVHRVNSDKSSRADIGEKEFGGLLGKILAAGPNLSLQRR